MKTRIILAFIILALTACAPALTPVPTGTPIPRAIPPTPTLFTLPTFPLFTAIPPSPIALSTETPSPMPTATPIVPYTSDRFRKAFIKEGNLYVQDGLMPPIQLTQSGKDRDPIISYDGKKIVFYRGKENDNVYSINSDGSQEQLIIKSESLPVLGQGEVKALTFKPKTHYLLFNTYLCNPRPNGPSYNAPDCTVGIYEVNTDSKELRQLIAGLSGNTMHERNFEISPDGKYISVAASGHINIYVGNDIVYQNTIIYNITRPDEFLPLQYWLPDSSGLIAVIATDEYNEPGTAPSTYAAYRYTIDSAALQIPLGATIMQNSGCNFSFSPDRNWIYFIGNETGDRTAMPTLFLGNLKDGSTRAIEGEFNVDCPTSYSRRWSPDSRYYAFEKKLVGIDGTVIPIDGHFSGWIDPSHYTYKVMGELSLWETRIGEIGGESIPIPEGFVWPSAFVILPPNIEP